MLFTLLAFVVVASGQSCSGRTRLTAESGVITDGSGNVNYADGIECFWWVASANANDRISISFDEFETECVWDMLFIYDGNSVDAPLLGAFSGSWLPDSVVSSSSEVLVHFSADHHLNFAGFSLSYTMGPCPFDCNDMGTCLDGRCVCNLNRTGDYCQFDVCPVCLPGSVCVNGVCEAVVPNSWEMLAPTMNSTVALAEVQRMGHAMVLHPSGDSLLVFGGETWSAGHLDDLLRFDLTARQWEIVNASGDMPPSSTHHTFVLGGSTALLFGGRDTNRNALGDLHSFNAATAVWTKVDGTGTPPSARFGHAACVSTDNRTMFISGGGTDARDENDLLAYDIGGQAWSTLDQRGDLPQHFQMHSLVAMELDGDLVLLHLGGTKRTDPFSNDLFMFHVPSRVWTKLITPLPRPAGRLSHAAVVLGTKMFLFGGRMSDNSCYADEMWEYDLLCNAWTELNGGNATSRGRYLTALVAAPARGVLFQFGGFRMVQRGDVWRFTPGPIPFNGTCPGRCSSHLSCLACTQDDACGWCAEDAECLAGTVSAPTLASCSDWNYAGSCSAASCGAHPTCSDCHVDACEWCYTTEQCQSAASCLVPYSATCPIPCTQEEACADCAERPECEWCSPQNRCFEADTFCSQTAINDPASCVDCTASSSCGDCLLENSCMWCERMDLCIDSFKYLQVSEIGECSDYYRAQTIALCPARCDLYTSCASCLTDADCGWCATTNECLAGTLSGNEFGNCTGVAWEFQQCACGHTECDNCVADPKCGWCASTSACSRGGATAPEGKACAAWDYLQCYDCGKHSNCATCVADDLCGYCHANQVCLRGASDGVLACPSVPRLAGWDFEACRGCDHHADCYSCVADPVCGYCQSDVSNSSCVRGDSNGAFFADSSSCPAWDYDYCNYFCENSYSHCETCVVDPLCGWCCETNSCQAGGCLGFYAHTCPNCSSKKTCADCASDLCCGWCDTQSSCLPGDVSGPHAGTLCASTSDPTWITEGNCAFDCDQFYACDSCAIRPECGWCWGTSQRNGWCESVDAGCVLTHFDVNTCHDQTLETIPYTVREDDDRPTIETVLAYATLVFVGSLVGIICLTVISLVIEDRCCRNENFDEGIFFNLNELGNLGPANLPPIITVYVPEDEDVALTLRDEPVLFDAYCREWIGTSVLATVLLPTDVEALEDGGVPILALGQLVARRDENAPLPMATGKRQDWESDEETLDGPAPKRKRKRRRGKGGRKGKNRRRTNATEAARVLNAQRERALADTTGETDTGNTTVDYDTEGDAGWAENTTQTLADTTDEDRGDTENFTASASDTST